MPFIEQLGMTSNQIDKAIRSIENFQFFLLGLAIGLVAGILAMLSYLGKL